MLLIKNVMKRRIYICLIVLFWTIVFGYMFVKEMYVVITLSVGILTMILAFATSNDN